MGWLASFQPGNQAMSCPKTDSLQNNPTVSEVEEAIPHGEEWMLYAWIYG